MYIVLARNRQYYMKYEPFFNYLVSMFPLNLLKTNKIEPH